MKYEEIIKNKRLTDYEETKETVIHNILRGTPEIKKKSINKWDNKQKRL